MSLFGRCLFAFFLLFAVPLMAQPSGDADWLYKGTDIPRDPAWQTGTLPNGVRYMVRRNAMPAGQVSIRVRIAAGALNEDDGERGWAHLVEHIVFRGTKSFDGKEAENILQQLGARPGGDTNASTGPTQTIYQLDLPKNDRELIGKALNIMSEMVDSARFEDVAVDSERKIVMAERSARLSQLGARIDAVSRPHFYAGLKIAKHDIIGSEETLAGVTPARLRAFYERWYRPELATVVIVGDADPAMLTEMLTSYFNGWRGEGTPSPKPDFGKFTPPQDSAATLVAAGAAAEVRLMWYRPFVDPPINLERQRFNRTLALASTIINRRLEARARENAPFLSAGLSSGVSRYIGDTTQLTVSARDGRWREALEEVFGILADAMRAPPDASEIERELSNIRSNSQTLVRIESSTPSPVFATLAIGAVESGYPPMAAAPGLEQFEIFARQVTPAQVADATRQILSGAGPQIMLLSPEPVEGGASAVTAALASALKAAPAPRPVVRTVSMDALPKLGSAGKEKSRKTIADMGVTIVRFDNGASLIFKQADFIKGTVAVQLRIGTGLATMPDAPRPPGWMGSVVSRSGIGDLNFLDVQRLFTGRRVGLSLGLGENGLQMFAVTSPEDLGDQLRLFALQLAFPRWDTSEFERARASTLQSYDQGYFGSASSRAARENGQLVHGGDQRWANWSKDKVAATTEADFRRTFEPLLTKGALELVVVGDVGLEQAVAAAAQSIGAMPKRQAEGPVRIVKSPQASAKPQIFTHSGDAGQAYVTIGWSSPGSAKMDFGQRRALATGAAILQSRLTERVRKELGATYSIGASSATSDYFPQWGVFSVSVQVKPENVDTVLNIAREEVARLARSTVDAEEFARIKNPGVAGLERDQKTIDYWVSGLVGWTTHPELIEMQRHRLDRMKGITPEDVRKAVATYVADEGDWSMVVLPEKKTATKD